MDKNARQDIVDRLKEANNVLVTVSNNPSVDQLAACIGLTLLLNKIGKHGTAVFSGEVPSTLEFLQPEKTIETNTDSLRDFIISLDKSKADKLRYKVEDKVVKIFITPYRTSLGQDDLEFSQGDFNVDVVMALGVREREELDQAITAHGRILHDATVISINNREQGNLGAINWVDAASSSLSEMVVSIGKSLGKDVLDEQMATAFLTGIVAETERFSNEKTSPQTMTIASDLMAAGANQQLVATKLEEAEATPEPSTQPLAEGDEQTAADQSASATKDDGALHIEHSAEETPAEERQSNDGEMTLPPVVDGPAPSEESPAEEPKPEEPADSKIQNGSSLVLEPPTLGGRLTANDAPEHTQYEASSDPLSQPAQTGTLLNRDAPVAPKPVSDDQTLANIEASVDSPHLDVEMPAMPPQPTPPEEEEDTLAALGISSSADSPDGKSAEAADPAAEKTDEQAVDSARNVVEQAMNASGVTPQLEPIEALGAQHVDLGLDHTSDASAEPEQGNNPVPPSSDSATPSSSTPSDQLTPFPGETDSTSVASEMPTLPTMPTPSMSGTPDIPVHPEPTPLPPNLVPQDGPTDPTASPSPAAPPPPVPPPMMPPMPGAPDQQNDQTPPPMPPA